MKTLSIFLLSLAGIVVQAQTVEEIKREESVLIQSKNSPLVLLNGKSIPSDSLKKIDPNTIESIEVIKGQQADSLYGEKGRNGVIVIKQKNFRKPE